MQRRTRRRSGSQQGEGADLHSPPLSPLEPLHRRQAQPSVSRLGRHRCNPRPDAQRSPRCSAVFTRRMQAAAAPSRPTRRSWPSPKISIQCRPSAPTRDIFTLDLTNPAAKPVKVSTSLGGDFNPAYSPDGKYLAWRSQARAGYESDKFRLVLYDRAAKTDQGSAAEFDQLGG